MLGFISKHGHKLFFCENCLGVKSHSESVIARNIQLCSREDWCSVIPTLPSPGFMLEFKNFKYQTPAPFTIYIDCESLTEPIDEYRGNTTFYQRHKCCSAAALLVSNVPMFNDHWFSYTGEDAIDRLLEKLIEWEEKCVKFLKRNRPMKPLTREQQMRYDAATTCCICKNENRPFDPEQDDWRTMIT